MSERKTKINHLNRLEKAAQKALVVLVKEVCKITDKQFITEQTPESERAFEIANNAKFAAHVLLALVTGWEKSVVNKFMGESNDHT